MSKRLAIEWDSRQLRVVAGITRGNQVMITNVASATLESNDPQQVGNALKKLLHDEGLVRLPASVAIGRGKAELRDLKLPPVPDEELPEMVRFEAMRSFASASERSAIDFLPVSRDSETVRVIAAAVGPDQLKNTALVAVPSQTAVEHLILRPLAAAALYRNTNQPCEGEVVLIDLLADDADIVVLRDGAPIFVRSVRMPDETGARIRSLSGEIRRSLMACQQGQQDQNPPRRVVMWGRREVHSEEVAGLSSSLGTDVQTLNPFTLVDVDDALKSKLPEHVGRLAPLVGMLQAETTDSNDLIDFLNPRRAAEPASPRRALVIAGVAALAAVLLLSFFGWRKLRSLDQEIAALEQQSAELEPEIEKADALSAELAKLNLFLDGNVIWLDEMRRAAERLPPSDQAIVTSVTANADRQGGGGLTLVGGVTRSSLVAEMERSLRDENHTVVGKGTDSNTSKIAPYDWSFTETIIVPAEYVRSQRETARNQSEQAPADGSESEPSGDDTQPDAAAEAKDSTPAPTEPDNEQTASGDDQPNEPQSPDEPAAEAPSEPADASDEAPPDNAAPEEIQAEPVDPDDIVSSGEGESDDDAGSDETAAEAVTTSADAESSALPKGDVQ